MANTIAIKRRITSVRNTRQITKAMELVSASKMRRAQEAAQASRAYKNLAQSILRRLGETTDVSIHPLFKKHHKVMTKLYVVITGDRGLSGAYNGSVLRRLVQELAQDQSRQRTSQCIAVGKRGAQYIARLDAVELLSAYEQLPDKPTATDIQPVLDQVCDLYRRQVVDQVVIIYTDYKSSVVQEVTAQTLLPAVVAQSKAVDAGATLFEPTPAAVLEMAATRLIEVQLWQALLESKASEFSMSMMAMKSASDNATDIIDDLTLAYNTARQAAITQELAEITGGAEALQ